MFLLTRKKIILIVAATAMSLTTVTLSSPITGAGINDSCHGLASLAWAEEISSQTTNTAQPAAASAPTSTASVTTAQPAAASAPTSTASVTTAQPAAASAPTSTASVTTAPTISALEGASQIYSSFLDVLHREISQRIANAAAWLDSFFADPNYVKEQNHSYAKFRYDVFQEEKANMTLNPAVDLRLALPSLERKTHLVFSAERAQPANDVNAPVSTPGERFGLSEQSNLTTAVQYIFRTTPQESFYTKAGVQFSRLSPVLLFQPHYRVLFPYSVWNIRFTQEVLWRTDNRWQTDTRFDFERVLPHALFFRTTLDGVWAEQTKGYNYSISFALRQPLAPTHALDYEWLNSFQTRPVGELTEVAFRVRYRHSYWREWLFFEVSPQLRFPRSGNFDILPGILFRLEMFFGG